MQKEATLSLLENITTNDAYNIAKWLTNEKITKYLNEDSNVVDSILNLLKGTCPPLLTYHFNKFGRFFIISVDNAPVGYIKLVNKTDSKAYEVVIVIGEDSLWGMGIGQKALRKCLDIVFFDWRANSITAKVHDNNTRSKKLFASSGFVPVSSNNNITRFQLTFDEFLSTNNPK